MNDLKEKKEHSEKVKIEEISLNYEEKIKKNARNEEIKKFARRFNKLLEEKSISNKKFAIDTKISPASISNYRSGLTMPNNDILKLMAEKLEVSVNYLLGIDECKKYSAQQIHNMLGLSEFAMEHLYSLRHNIPEVKYLDAEEPVSDVFKNQLETLSLLIGDKKNLIYILNSIERYIDKKNELKILKKTMDITDILEKNRVESLTKDIIHIKAEIQEYLYDSLDYIANKLLKE